jgi:hypothetical protein
MLPDRNEVTPVRWWSGCGGEGDAVAECFELADVVDLAPFGTDPVVEELGAKIAVAAGGVGEQVPDDDEDGAGDGDEGLELSHASGEAAVSGAEECEPPRVQWRASSPGGGCCAGVI